MNIFQKKNTFLGCHPLFGHTISSPVGQLVALTGYKLGITEHEHFKRFLTDKGLIVTELSPSEHDSYMAIVQALTHFCLMSFAGTLLMNDYQPSQLLKLGTPNFQFLYAFTSRVLKQSTTTTGSIQFTKEASSIREKFLRTVNQLHKQFSTADSIEKCASVMDNLRKSLAGDDLDEGSEVAALAVDSLQRFSDLMHKYKTSGFPFVFRHRPTGKLHVVKILEITHDEVLYEESTKFIQYGNETRLAIGLNNTARSNYEIIGVTLPTPEREKIKKRNIKLLSSEEIKGFYRSNIYPIDIIKQFRNPHEHTEEYFENWLPMLVKGLWQCNFLEAYRHEPSEPEEVTLKLIFNPNSNRNAIVDHVKKLIEESKL